jgi:hypothetical protein
VKIPHLAVIIPAILLGVAPAMAAGGFVHGPRPESSVFDPSGILSAENKREISEPLDLIRASERIDILVIILPTIGNTPPQNVANSFAEAWCENEIHAIVLHVPGRHDSPWIVPSPSFRRIIRSGTLDETLRQATRRAAAEPTHHLIARAASIEAADALRHWTSGAVLSSEVRLRQQAEARLALEKRRRLIKMSVISGAGVVSFLGLALVWIFLTSRKRGSRHFPGIRVHTRLGAPHAGGNHTVLEFKRPSRP